MRQLRKKATKSGLASPPWASELDFLPLENAAYRSKDGVEVVLKASLKAVEAVLTKALKPGRELVKVLRVGDKLADVTDLDAYRKPAAAAEPEKPKEEPKAAVGATVAQPVKGCPMPAFPEADVRASRVLEAFLSPRQIADYRRDGAFVTRGIDTQRRYLICNRERPAFMKASLGGRQLYDLDRGMPICVHDWAVPPPEEMLALHLCLSLPGREKAMLLLPEMDAEEALRQVDPLYRPYGFA